MKSISSYRTGVLMVTLSAIAWSTAGLYTRLVTVDTPTMLLWRGLFGTVGLFIYIWVQKRGTTIQGFIRMGRNSWLYIVAGTVAMQLFVTSLRYTSVAHASIIYAAIPFVAGGLGWLILHEKPSRTAITASFFALIGVGIMMMFGHGEGHISGDLMALGMTIGMALLMVLARRFDDIDLLSAACTSTLISALISLPFASHTLPDAYNLFILACFGLINSGLGFALFAYGSKLIPATETALIGALDAPLAPVWVWLFLSETPQTATLIGGAVVFTAVMANIGLSGRNST